MPYPYKKMTQEDFDKIIEITDNERVWVGDEIAKEYYKDEMPEYGVFPPELYVEVLNKEEVSEIMKYAYEQNIPVVCRGAGTGLAGGATCKYGGIMLSVMRMNKIFPVDHKNQTITAQPGALLIDIQAAAKEEGLFYPPDPGEKTASIGGNVITNAGGMKAVRCRSDSLPYPLFICRSAAQRKEQGLPTVNAMIAFLHNFACIA